MYEKLKSWLQDDTLFGVTMVVLVGLGSFGLGRLSVQQSLEAVNTAPASIFQAATPLPSPPPSSMNQTSTVETISEASGVVASRSGTKYHLPDCPGAKQMKPENKIEFATRAAAEAAGYTPAANCPGL